MPSVAPTRVRDMLIDLSEFGRATGAAPRATHSGTGAGTPCLGARPHPGAFHAGDDKQRCPNCQRSRPSAAGWRR